VQEIIENSNIYLGAQNIYCEDEGAYTGEISPLMIKELGCRYVILGHSERRQIFGESDELINKKVKAALKYSLIPILCIGETLKQRKNDKTLDVIKAQLDTDLDGIEKEKMQKIIIAYEPIWAIGTGETATPAQAQESHSFIRKYLKEKFDQKTADKVKILYGGSVKPHNIEELIKEPDLDGALVGGASLEARSFSQIIKKSAEEFK
jgi:triosephosphate isomerase